MPSSAPPCCAAKRLDVVPRPPRSSPRSSRGVTVTPPWRSASVTTPIGSETQASTSGCGGPCSIGAHAAEPHQLRRAAADVEQDHALRRRIDQRRAAGRGKPRLGLAIDDLELDADLARARAPGIRCRSSAARQASVAISRARVTPRLRILSRQTRSASTARTIAASLSTARAGDALAEPDDAGERIDDAEAVARRARHQQPAVVGAEIERGIGRTGQVRPARAVMARVTIWRPPAPPVRIGRPMRDGAEAGRPGLVVH